MQTMALKLTIFAAAFGFIATAVASQIDRGGSEPASPLLSSPASPPFSSPARPEVTRKGYTELLAEIDQRIDALQARANGRRDDWLIRMHLGSMILERAGLTNDADDFARVQALLDESFAIARTGSGPLLLAARFNFSIHRLDIAERYLDQMDGRAMQKREERAVGRVLRAQIAAQRGQYASALDGLREVAAVMPAAATAELALYHAKTGNPAQAEALLEDAVASTSAEDPRRRAWLRLQLGLVAMNRGDHLQALERLRAADGELPGWWLVQEHIAEAYGRLDHHREAIAIFDELVRTGGLPQHMDALASAYRHAGEPELALPLIQRAEAAWEQQLVTFSESAMGHGLAHHLQFGTPERALELALTNYAVRPGGDARVALAQAYLRAGRPIEALEHARAVLGTVYRSAALHHTIAQAHTALGQAEAAAAQLELCAALDPTYRGELQHAH
jgi:tetratricopeptide (TPR) repeat protein